VYKFQNGAEKMKMINFQALLLFIIIVMNGALTHPALCADKYRGPTDLNPLSATERLVMQRIQQGCGADLGKKRIRARFLEALLSGEFTGLKIHYHGICIKNAVIQEEIDLKCAQIDDNVELLNCSFKKPVILKDSLFKKNLMILNSQFEEDVDFHGLKIEGNAWFYGSTFNKKFNISQAIINKELCFSLPCDPPCDPKTEYLCPSTFKGLSLFDFITVGSCARFQYAIFEGEVYFRNAQINGTLLMLGSQFLQNANFGQARIGQSVNFEDTNFDKIVVFTRMEAKENCYFENAKFKDPGKAGSNNQEPDPTVNFAGIKIGCDAFFPYCEFEGRVNFDRANIGGKFLVTSAKFNSTSSLKFTGLIVGQLAKFTDTFFNGAVDLSGAKIGEEFKTDVRPEAADVKRGAIVEARMLKEQVWCNDALFSNLTINGLDKDPLQLRGLDLGRTIIERKLVLKNLKIKNLDAWHLKVKGQTIFENVQISNRAKLRGSEFSALDIINTTWPKLGEYIPKNDEKDPDPNNNFDLSGITFQFADIKKKKSDQIKEPSSLKSDPIKEPSLSWIDQVKEFVDNSLLANSPLLKWINQSSFNSRNYVFVEQYLNQTGNKREADKVFITMKRHEWGMYDWVSWLSPTTWLTILLWDLPVGYGRKPIRIAFIALGILIIGAFRFDPDHLMEVDWPKNNYIKRLGLSLDIFTPSLLNLGLEGKWKPPMTVPLQRFIFIYRLIGRICMAILAVSIWEYFKH
jgi:uncharacterized protein YjbI with pentapeptide repeats